MSATQTSPGQVAAEMAEYMRKHGGGYRAWYVGVASDPRARLFQDHNVHETGDAWIYRGCGSDAAARQVEAHFLSMGCQGGKGGGGRQSRHAYAYRFNNHTME